MDVVVVVVVVVVKAASKERHSCCFLWTKDNKNDVTFMKISPIKFPTKVYL